METNCDASKAIYGRENQFYYGISSGISKQINDFLLYVRWNQLLLHVWVTVIPSQTNSFAMLNQKLILLRNASATCLMLT